MRQDPFPKVSLVQLSHRRVSRPKAELELQVYYEDGRELTGSLIMVLGIWRMPGTGFPSCSSLSISAKPMG